MGGWDAKGSWVLTRRDTRGKRGYDGEDGAGTTEIGRGYDGGEGAGLGYSAKTEATGQLKPGSTSSPSR